MPGLNDLPETQSRGLWLRVGGPIIALVVICMAGALGVLWSFAQHQDREFARESRLLVANAVSARQRALQSTVTDFGFWTDAYRSISIRWDQNWVEANYTSAAADGIIVFSADGAGRYAWFSDGVRPDRAPLAQALLSGAGSVDTLQDAAARAVQSDRVSNAAGVYGRSLFLISTAPISWGAQQESVRGRPIPSHFVSFVDFVDAAEFAEMGEALGLEQLSFAASADVSGTGLSLALANMGGEPIGFITWRHERPGAAGFLKQAAPIIIGLLLLGVLALLIARHLVAGQLKQLALTHAALDASRLKSDFIATMSHELRTPLNAIINYTEMVREEAVEDGYTTAVEDLDRVLASSQHLLQMISEVLDISKIEAGRVDLSAGTFDAGEFIRSVARSAETVVTKNGNALDLDVPPALGICHTDQTKLKQCLLNLLSNAGKFTAQGKVSLRASMHTRDGARWLAIEVADTGIGIPADRLVHLFQPFVQADSSITRAYGGTGLGLAITKKLAELMGGDVTVKSESNVGSTFLLTIPASLAAAPGDEIAQAA
jgi:signal transduction histidine kinase